MKYMNEPACFLNIIKKSLLPYNRKYLDISHIKKKYGMDVTISFNQALLISPSATYGKKATPMVIVDENVKANKSKPRNW